MTRITVHGLCFVNCSSQCNGGCPGAHRPAAAHHVSVQRSPDEHTKYCIGSLRSGDWMNVAIPCKGRVVTYSLTARGVLGGKCQG